MRKDLDGLCLAAFREGKMLSACVDYSYIADNEGKDEAGKTRKLPPSKGLITRTDVYLINDNFTLFAGTGEESNYIVKSIASVLQDICRQQQEKAGVDWYSIDEKPLYSGAIYMFGQLSSTCFTEFGCLSPDMGQRVESIDFGNNCIKASDTLYNLKAILLNTGEEVWEMMKRSGVRLWTNLSTSQSCGYEVCNDIAQKYILPLPENQGGQPQQEAPEFPDELNTPEARMLIDKAVEAGFITVEAGRYKWNGTKVLLSYFAVKATAYLRLRTKDKATARWKPFEILFQKKALRQSKADFEKWNPDLTPTGADKIDALFE